ncbi:MAG TPA: arylsulfatase [Ginsengibacter sp.]|nr:arylsulfatase [Ginsengibacter sp.]HRP43454.1 arylsulfatase [Ginsengibacter sp.]
MEILRFTILVFSLAFFSTAIYAQKSQQPNIVVIMADDMGYGDISALNPDSKIHTPVLDRLIKEGRYLSEAHTSAALCTPARYAFLTGRYNFRTGITGVASGYSKPMIEYERETVASLLKKAGYQTGIVGKWHLGLEWLPLDSAKPVFTKDDFMPENLNVDYTKPVRGVNEVGFDYSFISPAGNNLAPYCFIRNGQVVNLPTAQIESQVTGAYFNDYEKRHNGGAIAPDYKLINTLETLTGEAVNYLEGASKNKKPFFLFFSLTAPHFPWVPQKRFVGRSDAGSYGDFVTEIDATVGIILDKIKDLGVDDNTLVIFTADNGGATPEGFTEKYHHEMNYGRRGQKGEIWEGGVRVPFIVRWPGVVMNGKSSDKEISFTDMLASFAQIAGTEIDRKYGEDSYDVSSVILGTRNGKRMARGAIVNQSGNVRGLSVTEDGWKLIPYGYGRHGLTPAEDGQPKGQLYNLRKDKMETENLYNHHPEIVRRLSSLLEKYISEGYSRPGKE